MCLGMLNLACIPISWTDSARSAWVLREGTDWLTRLVRSLLVIGRKVHLNRTVMCVVFGDFSKASYSKYQICPYYEAISDQMSPEPSVTLDLV
jgi:hypothetical protein